MFFVHWPSAHAPQKSYFFCLPPRFHLLARATGCPLYSAKQKFCRWFYWPIFGCVSSVFFPYSFCWQQSFLHAFVPEANDRQSGIEFVYFGFSFLWLFFMVLLLYLRGFKVLLWFKHLLIVCAYVNSLSPSLYMFVGVRFGFCETGGLSCYCILWRSCEIGRNKKIGKYS